METAAGAAVAVGGQSPHGPRARLAFEERQKPAKAVNLSKTSLVSLCLGVVVTALERYPAEAFGLLSEDCWDSIITLRHQKTQPKEGSGGLDGTGRVAPTVSDRFMTEVEEANEHLSYSRVVDQLVWKDCVQYSFREGGLTRPRALMLPWPLLVEKLRISASSLLESIESTDSQAAILTLGKSPMNLSLLQQSEVGKHLKKAMKIHKGAQSTDAYLRLEKLLSSWRAMAEENGVAITGSSKSSDTESASFKDDKEDLEIAETCLSWRQLFHALKLREDTRRSNQGKRMREIRRNLASDRPKVVKVRPTSAKHARILARPEERHCTSASPASYCSEISKLRKESAVVAFRQQRTSPTPQQLAYQPKQSASASSSFGAAVAFAAASKRASAKKTKTTNVKLAGGKQMNVPNMVVKGAGPRQMAAKFKAVGRR